MMFCKDEWSTSSGLTDKTVSILRARVLNARELDSFAGYFLMADDLLPTSPGADTC